VRCQSQHGVITHCMIAAVVKDDTCSSCPMARCTQPSTQLQWQRVPCPPVCCSCPPLLPSPPCATHAVVIPQQGYRSHGPAQVVSGSPGGARSPGGRSPRQPPSRLPSFQRASIKEEFSDDDDDSSDEDDRLSLAASRQSQVMSRRGGSAVGADSFVAPGSHASRPLSPRAASPSGVGLHYTVSAEAASRASQAPSLRAEGSVVEDLGAVASAAASFNVGLEASAAVAAAAQQHPPQQQQRVVVVAASRRKGMRCSRSSRTWPCLMT
jgi:hypothetical protein